MDRHTHRFLHGHKAVHAAQEVWVVGSRMGGGQGPDGASFGKWGPSGGKGRGIPSDGGALSAEELGR